MWTNYIYVYTFMYLHIYLIYLYMCVCLITLKEIIIYILWCFGTKQDLTIIVFQHY